MIDSSNELKCIQCGSGLIPSGDQLSCVINCPLNCLNCSNSTNCQVCASGYAQSEGKCTKNSCNSSRCSLCTQNNTCLQCDQYSSLSNGTCQTSCGLANCSLCKLNSTECEKCENGFSLNSWNKRCISSPINNC